MPKPPPPAPRTIPGPGRIVHIQAEAPAKPELGQPCNGCGLCCLSEPCPVGVLASRRRQGACAALRWSADSGRYVCGMLDRPWQELGAERTWALDPGSWPNRALARLCRRWIAAGIGCDADLQVQPAPPSGQATRSGQPGPG